MANVSLSLEVINTAGCLDAQADAMRPPPVDVKPHMLDAKTCGSVPQVLFPPPGQLTAGNHSCGMAAVGYLFVTFDTGFWIGYDF